MLMYQGSTVRIEQLEGVIKAKLTSVLTADITASSGMFLFPPII